MTKTNTWDYRFAFRAEDRIDVPPEFRNVYDRLASSNGRPVFGLFTPSIKEHAFLVSDWVPPKLILAFQESLALLSLDCRSNQVRTFELARDDFLGFGLAEHLLNCWLTLYPGDSADGRMLVRFPSRASEHFEELGRFLLKWWDRKGATNWNASQPSIEMRGLPAKFSSFLQSHPEFGAISEFFFQPAIEPRNRHQKSSANLLLTVASEWIVALGDQYRHERSEFGIEMTYLRISSVRSAEWIESPNDGSAVLQICLQGRETHSMVSWRVFAGLRPYALRWIEAVNRGVMPKFVEPSPLNKVTGREIDEGDSNQNTSSKGHASHVRS